MEAVEEDPVAFLARMADACPDVLSFLSIKQAKLLSKNPTDTYNLLDVNEEYLTDMACYHSVRTKSNDCRSTLSKYLLTPRALAKPLDVEEFEKKRKVLNEVSVNYLFP